MKISTTSLLTGSFNHCRAASSDVHGGLSSWQALPCRYAHGASARALQYEHAFEIVDPTFSLLIFLSCSLRVVLV